MNTEPGIYQVTVTTLTMTVPQVDVYEVAANNVLDALDHLKGCGWVRWDLLDSIEVRRLCRARVARRS